MNLKGEYANFAYMDHWNTRPGSNCILLLCSSTPFLKFKIRSRANECRATNEFAKGAYAPSFSDMLFNRQNLKIIQIPEVRICKRKQESKKKKKKTRSQSRKKESFFFFLGRFLVREVY